MSSSAVIDARADARASGTKASPADTAPIERILTLDPVLRLVVPTLVIAFIATLAVAALVRIGAERDAAMEAASADMRLTLRLIEAELARDGASPAGAVDAVARVLERRPDRRIAIVDASGLVLASDDASGPDARALGRIAAAFPATAPGEAEHARLASGADVLISRRIVDHGARIVVVAHDAGAVTATWRGPAAVTAALFATTAFVILLLGFAFHWQAIRSTEAEKVSEKMRRRIETALDSGRCGLWDWDLARGRIHWSASMFDMLGLKPRRGALAFGEIEALLHPADGTLYDIAAELLDDGRTGLDRVFRFRHANGGYVMIRARAELVAASGDRAPHLVGIAVDVTEHVTAAERTAAADIRLRDAIEAISEAFVLWDADNRLVLCNSKFRSLHGLSAQVAAPGARYDDVMGEARAPVVRTTLQVEERAGRAPRPTNSSSPTNAGSRSTNGAPATAASSRSAPTSRTSSVTKPI